MTKVMGGLGKEEEEKKKMKTKKKTKSEDDEAEDWRAGSSRYGSKRSSKLKTPMTHAQNERLLRVKRKREETRLTYFEKVSNFHFFSFIFYNL
jgi:hypothetical protein